MISENPSDAELIQLGIDSAMSRVHKAMPATVTAYDPVTNTAFVRPGVKQATYSATDDSRSYQDLPDIPFVPVIFPRAGGFVMRMPVRPGDSVLLVFCDTSLAEWRESGGVAEPQDARRHSLGWPVAIPGFFPDSAPMSPLDALAAMSQAIFGKDGGTQVRVGSTGIEFAPAGVTPISPLALSVPTDAGIAGAITAINAMGVLLTALIASLSTHTHLYAPGPGGPIPTAPPVFADPPPAAPSPITPAPTTASLLVRSM